jgi:hypothetical protein
VTVDGFRDPKPEIKAMNTKENGEYLSWLYALVAARDLQGLRKHTESASSPFQKTLGLAGMEHLLIQAGALHAADLTALAIPDDGADCTLAKAEALAAAGVAWAQAGVSVFATRNFEAAMGIVDSAGREMAFGKAAVMASIAVAQARAGMVATSHGTFDAALKLALQLPPRPKPVKGMPPKNLSGRIFQDDAYDRIFAIAIRTRDLGAARRTAALWRTSGGDREDGRILDAWMRFGLRDEALSYARGLKKPADRIAALLWLARRMLYEAGAPSP